MPLRMRMYDYIQRNPACHILEMAHHFQLSHPTVMYHLSVLTRQGLVQSAIVGKRRTHFDVRARYTAWEREVLALLALDEPRALLLRVVERPGTYPRELARDVPMSETTIKRHVPELLRLHLVQAEEANFRRRLWVAPTFRRRAPLLLAKLPPESVAASTLRVASAEPPPPEQVVQPPGIPPRRIEL